MKEWFGMILNSVGFLFPRYLVHKRFSYALVRINNKRMTFFWLYILPVPSKNTQNFSSILLLFKNISFVLDFARYFDIL